MIGPFHILRGSSDSRKRRRPRPGIAVDSRTPRGREQGVALVVVLSVIAVMTLFLAELMHNASTNFQVSVSQRDRLQAEYVARSGLNLTRLLISKEPAIRNAVAPLYGMLMGKRPPQLNVWDFAADILAPFSNLENAKGLTGSTGIDFSVMEGVADTPGHFEIVAIPENSMINVSKPLFIGGDDARKSIAMQLYALMGGYQSPDSPYDPMFEQPDPDGVFTSRLDVVSALIDWWDYDEQRTVFDPGAGEIEVAGSEDDIYSQFSEPYRVKNAPYDSLEELRLLRGVGEDFWASFVEGTPEDPKSRKVTIYGSGSVNPNQAPPRVLLARLCSFIPTQSLCADPFQAAAFVQLFQTARTMLPIAYFSNPDDFLNFAEGKGEGMSLYAMLSSFLPPDSALMAWTPVQIPSDLRSTIQQAFITSAAIFTIQSTGKVGRAEFKISSVVNFHSKWTPPPPNAGKVPALGVFHHYRTN